MGGLMAYQPGQTGSQESGEPGFQLILGCSFAFPNGIHPASLSLYPDPQTFVECL